MIYVRYMQLQKITDRMVHSLDYDVNAFLNDLDCDLEVSRDIFRQFDDVMRVISEEDWEILQLKVRQCKWSNC